jgi:peptidoglycan/LPS O-acetylase OafA/YrhL
MDVDNVAEKAHSLRYRHDIDGLRAIAVILVLLYHFEVQILSGGFVGVDIFFVISGFLITLLITTELAQNKFSFKKFWTRRIKRLLPASLIMMTSVFVVFSMVYPSSLFQDVGKSIVAQLFFSSNMYFWSGSGYFEVDSSLKPLLHTWSLSVEEQFYLIFPFYLFFLNRLAPSLVPVVTLILTISSLVLAVVLYNYEPSGAFYWLPTRSWELGIGACLALCGVRGQPKNSIVALIATATGLILIAIATLTFTKLTPFPSYFALLPVVGTALIIWGNGHQENALRALFCLKPIVFIGLISYSLYLWHWPVKVLLDWYSLPLSDIGMRSLALLFTLLISTLSYFYIEQPFRVASNKVK